jgi:hypothetical protein
VHLLAVIAEAQISTPHPAPSIEAQAAHKSFEEALSTRFQSWLNEFENSGSLDRSRAVALASSRTLADLAAQFREFEQRVSASNFAEVALWSVPAKQALLAQLQAYGRLTALSDELDHQLASVPLAPAA